MFAPLSYLYERHLYEGPPQRHLFEEPAGEPALVPSESVSWRVFGNPVTLFVGGVLAVILELALPPVRHGVWEHSTFRTAPHRRLQRTGLAAMVTIYGASSVATRMIEGVNALHARVSGLTEEGEPYAASDGALLTWVQATAAYGFGEAYSRLSTPLSRAQWDALFAEGAPVASLYGASSAPTDLAGWSGLISATAPRLTESDTLTEFLQIMSSRPVLPLVARPLQAPLVRVAATLVPPEAGLALAEWQASRTDHILAKAAARSAARLPIPVSPPVLAARRLGLDPRTALAGPLPSPGGVSAPSSP